MAINKIVKECIKNILIITINITSSKFPMQIEINAGKNFTSENTATALLVQTPARGNGIAQNSINFKLCLNVFLLSLLSTISLFFEAFLRKYF